MTFWELTKECFIVRSLDRNVRRGNRLRKSVVLFCLFLSLPLDEIQNPPH